jgi:zinc/manganese transport system substrate-binding protein
MNIVITIRSDRVVRSVAVLVAAVAAAGPLTACGSTGGASADISIVASTNVYASIAETLVRGLPPGRVAVTSILSDPSLDPHSYEASARNELALSRADLVLENGGGYDGFVQTLEDAAGVSPVTIDAVRLSGHADDAELNEHVWYDLPTMARVVARIENFFATTHPDAARVVSRNARTFLAGLRALEAAETDLEAQHGGTGVAITEAVPLYLLQACGLVNRTPAEFSQAVEEGTDASPRVLETMLDLFREHQVRLLVYNEQTGGPQTDQVIDAARANGVPVVAVTETLPAHTDYLSWMRALLGEITAALR